MANDDMINALGGLRPLQQPYGTVKKNYYRLTTSAVAVYIGQPMTRDANGQASVASVSTAAQYILGPVLGFAQDKDGKPGLPNSMFDLNQEAYLPAQKNAYVLIADDPDQIFVIQEASTATQLTTAAVGASAHFNYLRSAASGSTVTGASYAELDPNISGSTGGSSGALQIIGLADNFNSDGTWNALGAYAKWKVRIALHNNGGRVGHSIT